MADHPQCPWQGGGETMAITALKEDKSKKAREGKTSSRRVLPWQKKIKARLDANTFYGPVKWGGPSRRLGGSHFTGP